MSNWNKHWKKLSISWYNIKNEPEDDYCKKHNEAYQKNKDDYYKKIFHIFWGEYGICWQNTWSNTALIFESPEHLYWMMFKDSEHWTKKSRWKFKCWKQRNDHTSCG